MNEKSQQLYNYLKSNGLTDLDSDTFFSKYSDPNKSKEIWSYLNQNGMTDLDANAFYDSYFKKKSLTGSGLDGSSSDRLSKTTTKPTAYSSSEGEIFTGYPGKEAKRYNFKDGGWYEEIVQSRGKVVQGQYIPNPNIKMTWTKIKDPNRISNLNKQFKKDASLSQVEEVFNNYDEEKADNQYRIYQGQWQRMTPGSKWHTIQNEGSINALNKRYGKNVSTRITTTTTIKPPKFEDINSDFVGKTEENAIKYLTEKYGKYGFEFSEEGLFAYDQIRVKTKDGSKELLVEFDEKNPEQARKLRAFLEVNATKPYSENFNKALSALNKGDIEIKPQTGGSTFAFGTDQSSYEEESAAIRGKNLLSKEFQSEFKKLPFDEQKELIQKEIAVGNISSKDVQSFYKSEAYKDYKKKKIAGDQQSKEKQDQIFDEYQYALATKDPAKIKEAKAKINAYYTDDIIQDNIKTYNMTLNDLEKSTKKFIEDQKKYESDLKVFNELAQSGKMTKEQYDAQAALLNDRAESLQTRAQYIQTQTKDIFASQKKLNYVAGKYISAKEKEGGFGGFVVNKVLSGISMTLAEPFAGIEATENRYDYLSPEEKAYYKSIKHNGKNLTKEQIENLLDNQAILKSKKQAKESLIYVLGSEGTTLEYMKSGDRGWLTQTLGGVLESLPGMAMGVAGKAVGFVGLAAQAYSGIEEEMLSDPDFQYTSIEDRAMVAIPYAAAMGVLENVGLQNMVKGDSFLGKVMLDIAIKASKKAGSTATREVLEKIATKEVESLLAKGLLRISQAGVAEFETGFTQSLVLDQGLKQAYNWIQQSGMTEEQKKKLTQGEFFDTADNLKELGSRTFEDGLAEMVGGHIMGSVGTLFTAVTTGNVSLYNEDDVKFLKDVVTDSEFKKLYVASLKTQMLQGSITKSKAQQNLDNLNEIESAFNMMPNGLSTADMSRSLSLITERAQLNRQKTGIDPNLAAPIEARIKAINEELTKIGENAVQEQTTSEVPVQPGTAVSGEVAERKPETGLKEVTQKGKEEVDQYIANIGAEARVGNAINPVMEKMANAEYINDNEIDNAIEAIFNEVESLEKSDQYSPETKAAISDKLLSIADKLDNYEFRTKTETVATTKAGAATTTRRTSEAVQKIRAEKYFDGVQATVNGQEVTLKDNKGRVEAQMPNGEVIVLDTPTMEITEDGFEFDDSDALVAVTVKDRLGNTARLTGDQALDFAIRDRENKLGVVEQAEFDTVYQEVEKKYIKEVPTTEKTQEVAKETEAQKTEEVVDERQKLIDAYVQEQTNILNQLLANVSQEQRQQVLDELTSDPIAFAKKGNSELSSNFLNSLEQKPTERTEAKPSEKNLFTKRNAKALQIKFPNKKEIVKAALNIINALPGVKIYLHENTDQYVQELAARTGESKQSIQSEDSAGSYIDGEIHLDMSKANVVTLLHEAFHHAFLTLGIKNGMFIDLANGLRSLIKDKATLAELDEFIEQYEGETDQETLELKAEEFATQLGAILANNREELTTTRLTEFKALINRIAKKIGLGVIFSKAANSKEAADFINTISRGLISGQIIEGKFQSGKTGKAKFQADFSDAFSKLTFVYDKNNEKFKQLEKDGYITYDKSIYDFADKYMLLHQPDAAFSGAIYKNGELLVEGKGGVYYPIKFHEDGYFWASTSDAAKNMAKALNKILEQNGGTIYMALTTAPAEKLMSSTTMSNAVLDFFSSKAFDKNFKISESQLKKALIKSANDVKQKQVKDPKTGEVKIKNVGLNLGLKSSMTLDDIKSLIRSKLGPDNSSFQDRKNFSLELVKLMANDIKSNPEAVNQFGKLFSEGIQNKYFKGISKTGKLSISPANMTQAISEMFKEPLLKEGPDQSGQVYAIIELNGPVKEIDSDKHESYPKAIQSDSKSKVKMHILNDRQIWSDVFLDFEGDVDISKERKLKVFPTNTGVSPKGLKVKKSIKFQKGKQKTPNLAQNETGKIQPERTGDRRGRIESWKLTPLEGAPTVPGVNGPDPQIVGVAEKYAADNGIDLKRQSEYVEVDVERAKRIADAYEQMADDPQNPKVKEAYQDLINQTIAQYQALADAGYKFWFTDSRIPSNEEYLSTPYNALRDLRENKEMGVYPTLDGYGEGEITQEQIAANPMLADTGIKWPVGGLDGKMMPVLANDLFRAVHDAFGHGLEGAGFRARGEENAWQAHVRLFTGPAVAAITSETRGQNSWLNFGPFGEANRTAKIDDTVFAEQKVGLMPEWTWTEGRAGDMEAPKKIKFQKQLTTDKDAKPGYETALDALGETEAQREEWRKKNKVNQKQKRNTVVEQAVKDYYNEEINQEEYLDIVSKNQPIKPFKEVPALPSLEEITNSLDSSKVATGIVGLTKNIEEGEKVATRLDIPAYEDFDTWVVSIHDGVKEGKSVAYGQTAVLKNVDFKTFPGPAIRIAMGTQNKSTIARMFGNWVNEDPESVHARAKELMNDPAWTQVGMNPFRYSWFYDKADGMPLASAEEVVQVGALVLAKNAVKVLPSDPMFETKSAKGGKIKFQKAPKILGVKPTVVIVNDEQRALVDQIKLEVRAQREQKKAHKQVLADISARVTSLKSKGNISVKQFDAIMKNLKRLNFDNAVKVDAFIDYVSRALANADYIDKVQTANKLRKSIASKLKGKANPFATVAKIFTTLDPRWSENINDYIAAAQLILDGVKPSTTRGGVLKMKSEPDLQVIAEYINEEQNRQMAILAGNLKSRYEIATGKSGDGLSNKTMLAELELLKPEVDNTQAILDQIDQKLAEYSQMLTDEDPQVVEDAINIDTDEMSVRDAIRILESLDTYFTNGSIAGMDALVSVYKGQQAAKAFRYKSKPMRTLGSKDLGAIRLGGFAGFTRILERKFRSVDKANDYMIKSGINGIITGANKADFEAAKKQDLYIKKFKKIKGFYSNKNIYERGMIADLIRTNPFIDQEAEFQRVREIILDSRDMLINSKDDVEVEMGKLYNEVIKKLGLENSDVTVEDILERAEKYNVDAVNFAVDMFAEKFDQMSDTALGVYNTMLSQDINYTPKTYVNLKGKGITQADQDPLQDSILGLSSYGNVSFNRNEAGVLMPITRPAEIKSANKYVDLNFDNNMFRSYRIALTDSYTAKSIHQLSGFYNTAENESIIDSADDFDILKSALADYINTVKGKNYISKETNKKVDGALNKITNILSPLGAARALAGVGQFVNQLASGLSNTVVNVGEYMRPSDMTSKAFEFMNRSGQPIANVGENDILISLANFDKAIERSTVGKNVAEVTLDKFGKFNAKAFQFFVSNGDAVARRLAWMAYYRKYISKNNLGPIDFNAEPNTEAAAYAQSMVDRSMDTTDPRIRGSIYRSQDSAMKLIKTMLIPFSSFGMNQRNRMWTDLTKITTGDFDLDTARSLASIGAEIVIYNAIRYVMARSILYAAMNLLGYDDEEQDELIEKLKRNMMSSSFGKALVDVVSPIAILDNKVLELANYLMSWAGVGEPTDDDVKKFIKEENELRKLKGDDPLEGEQLTRKKDKYKKENSMQFYINEEFNYGQLGIQWQKSKQAYDVLMAMKNGYYVDEYGRNVYFDSEAKQKLPTVAALAVAGSVIPLREVGFVADKSFNLLKKNNVMSESKYDMYEKVEKKFGRMDPVLEKLAEKKDKLTSIEKEIEWINNNGGLKGTKEKKEYAKLIDKIPKPSLEMLDMIQRGKTAQEIIDQELKK
jgi:hypothetical protein